MELQVITNLRRFFSYEQTTTQNCFTIQQHISIGIFLPD